MTTNLLVHLKAVVEYIEFVTGNFAADWLLPATQLQVRNPTTSISIGESQRGSCSLFGNRYEFKLKKFRM
jgi:hypothetical protein